jgi:RimJ/RimL family protein N-acetyltransferase
VILFPSPLETRRLILRAPQPSDAEALNEAIQETFEQLRQWMPWSKERQTLEESIEFCRRMSENFAAGKDFAIFAFDRTGRFVLATGCHPRNLDVPSFEIGYWCRATEQGHGYAREAVTAVKEAAFDVLGAKRIEIRCDERNLASRSVAQRCGFELNATFKNECRNHFGALRTTLVYSLTQD